MKQILLLRHGKSAWDDPSLEDIDRPLAGRGVNGAKNIGAWLVEQDILPEMILCSPARRCEQTYELLPKALKQNAITIVHEDFYLPRKAILYQALQQARSMSRLMIIGHNPSLHDFAISLSQAPKQTEKIIGKFPTAACALFHFSTNNWNDISLEYSPMGQLKFFMTPKMLKKSK